MRLFVAVVPPDAVAAELASAVASLRELPGSGALRWTARESWHFTLAFLGEVDEAAVPGLTARLGRAAHRTPPFSLALRGGGHFGDRALWVGAAGGAPELRLLARRTEAAARKAGLAVEEHRAYRPHLTLARGRGGTELGPYADALDAFRGAPWTVRELTLVRSELPRSGVPGERPRYEVLGRRPLGGGAASPGGGSREPGGAG
ncbi:RNA 2',3'-cyclic phosphodiesterase [Streptomyces alfalfae]|uniref:RNA 2',3'-cyclic phosphodiesterase n=1 Tax=Streptomyces alfalfae TaxID=1642299 RepID=A0A1P8TJ63_9ACTN|nr:RNA 2',3'-cyclic phosphodiesterase [Streptomyces alfalfae]AYA18094.1 RNA 2',3'-cyclic phosphodiesterase [Streptomyces fradiae]APY87673.1 2'-5' RNA ligase [Streptomyces alfalfae]QQC89969.1 RNA 2',3'-cyclic phosphodiesterase [Streptomyces alfalfae]QUI32352.1 RNA 2',3'-cyclic phosphodiesterase [Streptomyces alfalfae]RXX40212.1 RNA 2',3'-cyclic phosphodiesterase [Streptomyces alfalfae]